MIDLLIADLEKEMTEAETDEKDAQADYEKFMGDSAEKRTTDSSVRSVFRISCLFLQPRLWQFEI